MRQTRANAMIPTDQAAGKDETLSPSGPRGPMASDAKRIARALAEIGASRKTILMYPPGHGQIQQSIDRACRSWEEILASQPEISIGTDEDGLLVGRDSSKLKDSISRELSSILRDRDLAVVHLRRGLSSEEIAAFLRAIAEDPEKLRAGGGIEKTLVEAEVRHIRVQCVDYSKFLHTEEEEIRKRPRGKSSDENDSIWGSFVTHLILGTLSDSEKGIPLRSAEDYAPRVIASYLNRNELDPQMALEGYEQTVEEHLARSADPQGGLPYRVANLRNLSALLEELQPGIRKQFLDATYRQCAARAENPLVEDLLSGMPQGFVLDMLRQANKQGNEISPTLLNLVRKIARVKEDDTGRGKADGAAIGGVDSDPARHKEILDLFDREAYETYVTSDYGETLQDLSREAPPRSAEMQPSDEIGKEIESLESPYLDVRIARALLAFMEADPGPEEYGDYADKIFRIANDLIGEGEFSVPLEIVHTLQRHVEDRADPTLRSAAADHLGRFRSPAFLSKALAAFDKWRSGKDGMAQAFLSTLGPDIAPQAFSLYMQRDQSESDHHLFHLLAVFADRVTEMAKKDLQTRRGPGLVRLIRLVRRLGTHDLIADLRPLLDRDDRQVQMEALETLVRFRDPESVDLLRKFLTLKEAEDQLRVIEIAGMHKVADLAQDLAARVKTFSFSRLDYARNEKIIEALGRIGHPCAIPALERLAKTRFSFYPRQLSDLKVLLFQSLRLYGDAKVGTLLRIGSRAKDARIRTACRECMQGREGAGRIAPPPKTVEVQDPHGSPAS